MAHDQQELPTVPVRGAHGAAGQVRSARVPTSATAAAAVLVLDVLARRLHAHRCEDAHRAASAPGSGAPHGRYQCASAHAAGGVRSELILSGSQGRVRPTQRDAARRLRASASAHQRCRWLGKDGRTYHVRLFGSVQSRRQDLGGDAACLQPPPLSWVLMGGFRGVRLALFGKWGAGGTRARGSKDEDEGTVLVDIMAETHVTRIGWRKASRSNIVFAPRPRVTVHRTRRGGTGARGAESPLAPTGALEGR
jgi:hypothetical protein